MVVQPVLSFLHALAYSQANPLLSPDPQKGQCLPWATGHQDHDGVKNPSTQQPEWLDLASSDSSPQTVTGRQLCVPPNFPLADSVRPELLAG